MKRLSLIRVVESRLPLCSSSAVFIRIEKHILLVLKSQNLLESFHKYFYKNLIYLRCIYDTYKESGFYCKSDCHVNHPISSLTFHVLVLNRFPKVLSIYIRRQEVESLSFIMHDSV